jgi:hypothetical protein
VGKGIGIHIPIPISIHVYVFVNFLKVLTRVDTKWRFQFFAKYDYRFLLDVIIAIIITFCISDKQ